MSRVEASGPPVAGTHDASRRSGDGAPGQDPLRPVPPGNGVAAATPAALDPSVVDALRPVLAQAPPAPVALMWLLLAGLPAGSLPARLWAAAATRAGMERERLIGLATLADATGPGLELLARMVAAGADHGPTTGNLDATRAMFDRLVAISPEASVAAYSLGDPERLAAATAEIVGWLDGQGVLAGRPAILDLGCGIGRLCHALAPNAGLIVGLDIAAGMLATARARCAAIGNVGFAQGTGRDLRLFRDAAFDLVLAVDVFPYLVQASPALAAAQLRECARVLRPGGSLAVLNWSYRDLATDRLDLAASGPAAGLALLRTGETPFRHWDGAAFWLRRAPA